MMFDNILLFMIYILAFLSTLGLILAVIGVFIKAYTMWWKDIKKGGDE